MGAEEVEYSLAFICYMKNSFIYNAEAIFKVTTETHLFLDVYLGHGLIVTLFCFRPYSNCDK
jgi:hypothetical protein